LKVRVRYLGTLKARLKAGEEVIEMKGGASSASEVLKEVVRRHGGELGYELILDDGSLPPGIMVNINGELTRGSEIRTKTVQGDSEVEILVIPAVAGGALRAEPCPYPQGFACSLTNS